MEIQIDIGTDVPIFAQIIAQIKKAVIQGHLKPGDAMPSIRQLARDLEVNNNTVAKSYRLLERDSVIQTRGYRGTVIHPNAVKNSTIDLNDWLESKLNTLLRELRDSGATDSE
ncbi:MAG: GntR family transcriptional regulator, partial [Calditrichota bacterium]